MCVQPNMHTADIVLIFFLCAFCVSVGTSGSQLTITMMKLKVMKEKKNLRADLHIMKSYCTGYHDWEHTSGTQWKTTGLRESAELQPPHYESAGHCEETSRD